MSFPSISYKVLGWMNPFKFSPHSTADILVINLTFDRQFMSSTGQFFWQKLNYDRKLSWRVASFHRSINCQGIIQLRVLMKIDKTKNIFNQQKQVSREGQKNYNVGTIWLIILKSHLILCTTVDFKWWILSQD